MERLERPIPVDGETSVSSVWLVPDGYRPGRDTALVLAHGAGNAMDSPFMCAVHEGLAARGLLTVKFNFPYTEQGRRAPDRAPRLEATYRAVVAALRADPMAPGRLVLGGKSMGGRIASHLAAEGLPADGLVFLGYPLHPAGKPERLRTDHLPRITCPMLFVQGTRDRLCDPALLAPVLAGLGARATLHAVEEGDHSFAVPKRSGRSPEAVLDEVMDAVAGWISALPPPAP